MTPREWLQRLEQTVGGYAALLDEHGGHLELAAHELATAKRGGGAPTAFELRTAALEIATRGQYLDAVPPARVLASMCRAAGLAVL